MKNVFASAILFAVLCMSGVWTNVQAADATIAFTDNSTNEDGFKLERNLNGGPFSLLTTLAPNVTQLLDTTLVQSTIQNVYCYRVSAFNSAGSSGFASTATPGVTDCKIVPTLITIPPGPSGILVK